jgi:hypothetical protein
MARDPMPPDLKRMEPATRAEAVRQACIEAALAAYADARLDGLCHEGAWECAVDAPYGRWIWRQSWRVRSSRKPSE